MSNLFFRTNIAPYRVDTYNALHEGLNCEMYFYWQEETSQKLNMETMLQQCRFTPHYLKGVKLGANSRKFCTQIWSILRKEKPKVVIVPEFQILTIQVLLFKWLFRKKFKVFSMCDDSHDMLENDNDFSSIHKYARKLMAPKVDDILLVDKRAVEWYQKNYGKGIWLPIIRDEKKERPLYESTLNISNSFNLKYNLVGKKVLLFVGRLVEVKNLTRLLSAIRKTNQNYVTVIVGDGPKMEGLKQLASNIDMEILFVGHFENHEIRAWYNVADVFILPSYLEPFGAVTNEALLAGCYSLVSIKAGSACLLEEGINGFTISPTNIDDMANKIDEAFKLFIPSKSADIKLKENKMQFSFNEIINNVFNKLKS